MLRKIGIILLLIGLISMPFSGITGFAIGIGEVKVNVLSLVLSMLGIYMFVLGIVKGQKDSPLERVREYLEIAESEFSDWREYLGNVADYVQYKPSKVAKFVEDLKETGLFGREKVAESLEYGAGKVKSALYNLENLASEVDKRWGTSYAKRLRQYREKWILPDLDRDVRETSVCFDPDYWRSKNLEGYSPSIREQIAKGVRRELDISIANIHSLREIVDDIEALYEAAVSAKRKKRPWALEVLGEEP